MKKYILIAIAAIFLFGPSHSAFAASRFWVGGTGTWDTTTTTHWAATSGGSGGASVPTTADTVTFDTSSNATGYTVTFAASAEVALDFTASNPASGNLTFTETGGATLQIAGSFTFLSSTIQMSNGVPPITFTATATGKTITTDTVTIPNQLTFNGVGGGWTLQDNLTCNPSGTFLNLLAGALNTNGKVVGGGCDFFTNGSAARSLTLGATSWTNLTSGNFWQVSSVTGFTLNAGTSVITDLDSTNNASNFTGGGLVYNNLTFFRSGSTGNDVIDGSNTFNQLQDFGSTASHSFIFTNGSTQTITTFSITGNATHTITLNSDTTATFALVKAGGGTVSSDYLNIQHSVATPANTWYAGIHSTNNQATATAGSGWIFTLPPTAPVINKFIIGQGFQFIFNNGGTFIFN